jgi:hypothetical protein
LLDLAKLSLPDLLFSARAEPLRGQLAGTPAHAVGDVAACDHEIAPGPVLATEHDVRMRVIRIPVIDGDPIESRAEIRFHAAHQLTRELMKVIERLRVFRRHYETELVTVTASTFLERRRIGGVLQRTVGVDRLAVLRHPIALDVAQVCRGRGCANLLELNKPSLDHDPARSRIESSSGERRSDVTAAELRTIALAG